MYACLGFVPLQLYFQVITLSRVLLLDCLDRTQKWENRKKAKLGDYVGLLAS